MCRIWRDNCVRSSRTRGVSLPAEWGVGQTAGVMSQMSYSKGGANYRQRGFSACAPGSAVFHCIYSNRVIACAALAQRSPCAHQKRDAPRGFCAVSSLAWGMARYLHYSCTTSSQGALPHAHSRQVWKAPRTTGRDSVVAPAPGTTGLRATAAHGVRSVLSTHRLPDPCLWAGVSSHAEQGFSHG